MGGGRHGDGEFRRDSRLHLWRAAFNKPAGLGDAGDDKRAGQRAVQLHGQFQRSGLRSGLGLLPAAVAAVTARNEVAADVRRL